MLGAVPGESGGSKSNCLVDTHTLALQMSTMPLRLREMLVNM